MLKEKKDIKTMETLLMRRLDKLFEAMDDGYGTLVDEIIDEMEMLFNLKPPIYNEIIRIKEQLLSEVEVATQEVSQLAEMARDEIQKRRFLQSEINAIDWEYRKDYVESIIMIMGKYQMIPYLQPDVTEMQSQYEIPHVETEEPTQIQQQQQQPIQQEQEPKTQQVQHQPQNPQSLYQQPPPQQHIQQEQIKNEPELPSPIPVKTEEKVKRKKPHLSQKFDV